jgi:hypothetical protein
VKRAYPITSARAPRPTSAALYAIPPDRRWCCMRRLSVHRRRLPPAWCPWPATQAASEQRIRAHKPKLEVGEESGEAAKTITRLDTAVCVACAEERASHLHQCST